VEDDREVLRAALDVLRAARALARERAALSLLPRDVVEDLLPVSRELHEHDRLARVRVDVRARAGKLEVGARHLRDAAVPLCVRQAVLQEVERLAPGDLLRADAVAGGGVAADDDRVLRDAEDRRWPLDRALLLLLRLLQRRQQIL